MADDDVTRHKAFALAHPVFDPVKQTVAGHSWRLASEVSVCLTVVHAADRPLWQLSLSYAWIGSERLDLSRWGRRPRRHVEAIAEGVMQRIGTGERVITEMGETCMHFRKPLSIEEINRMAPTAEVRARRGRP